MAEPELPARDTESTESCPELTDEFFENIGKEVQQFAKTSRKKLMFTNECENYSFNWIDLGVQFMITRQLWLDDDDDPIINKFSYF